MCKKAFQPTQTEMHCEVARVEQGNAFEIGI